MRKNRALDIKGKILHVSQGARIDLGGAVSSFVGTSNAGARTLKIVF